MAIVATGSTADIKEPNAKLGEHKRGNEIKEKHLPSSNKAHLCYSLYTVISCTLSSTKNFAKSLKKIYIIDPEKFTLSFKRVFGQGSYNPYHMH